MDPNYSTLYIFSCSIGFFFFSPVIKHYDQGNLKEEFTWAYGSRGLESITMERGGSGKLSDCILKQAQEAESCVKSSKT